MDRGPIPKTQSPFTSSQPDVKSTQNDVFVHGSFPLIPPHWASSEMNSNDKLVMRAKRKDPFFNFCKSLLIIIIIILLPRIK